MQLKYSTPKIINHNIPLLASNSNMTITKQQPSKVIQLSPTKKRLLNIQISPRKKLLYNSISPVNYQQNTAPEMFNKVENLIAKNEHLQNIISNNNILIERKGDYYNRSSHCEEENYKKSSENSMRNLEKRAESACTELKRIKFIIDKKNGDLERLSNSIKKNKSNCCNKNEMETGSISVRRKIIELEKNLSSHETKIGMLMKENFLLKSQRKCFNHEKCNNNDYQVISKVIGNNNLELELNKAHDVIIDLEEKFKLILMQNDNFQEEICCLKSGEKKLIQENFELKQKLNYFEKKYNQENNKEINVKFNQHSNNEFF